MNNIFKLQNILFLFVFANLILISGTFTKNNSSFWKKKEQIDLVKDAKSTILEKLNAENDVHMIIRSYEVKNNKLQSAQTKVFHRGYRKEPSYEGEQFSITKDVIGLKDATVKFVYNKCTDASHITQVLKESQKKQTKKIEFDINQA